MKKADIQVGETYAHSIARDLFTSWYSDATRVQVIDNDTFVKVNQHSIPWNDIMYSDKEFAAAHLAWSLVEAFPQDSTPREKEEAASALHRARYSVQTKWFEADEMRSFRRVDKAPPGSESGCLIRHVRDDGTLTGPVRLCPRRELHMLWSEYKARKQAQEKARNERAKADAILKAERDEKRKVLLTLVDTAFEGSGVAAPYISDYSYVVELTLDEAIVLFQRACQGR
jgi:hypothetical protein